MTRVYIPICVNGPGGFQGGPSGYYLRQPGDDRNGPLIVEPGVEAYPNPKETLMSGQIPISDARKIGEQRDVPMVVIFGIHSNGEKFCLTTWGKTRRLCAWAAGCGKDIHKAVMSGKVLDDTQHADDPYAEIERLQKQVDELEDRCKIERERMRP